MGSSIAGFRRPGWLLVVAAVAFVLAGLAVGPGQADARTKLPSKEVTVPVEFEYATALHPVYGDSCSATLMAKWKDVPGVADLEAVIRFRLDGIERLKGEPPPFDDVFDPELAGDLLDRPEPKLRVESGFHWLEITTLHRSDSQGKHCEKAIADIEELKFELISFEVAVSIAKEKPAVGKKCKQARKSKAILKRKVAKAKGKKAKRLKKQLKRAKAKVRKKC